MTNNKFDHVNPWSVHHDELLSYRDPTMPLQQWRQLRRGQLPIQAKLDLHGYRKFEAEVALIDFLEYCQSQQKQVVLIIHGKGAVLKSATDDFLRHHQAVFAYCSASAKHGGSGAVYVLLKKLRQT